MNENEQQVQVEESSCEKDLGVDIRTEINKANSKLRIICRSFEHLDGDMLIQLYKSIYS